MNKLELQSQIAPAALSRGLVEAGFVDAVAETDSGRVTTWFDLADTLRMAQTIACFLLQDWLFAFIEQRLQTMYGFLDEEEREYIALLTFHALRKERDATKEHVVESVAEMVRSALVDASDRNLPLSIDALVRFRLRTSLLSVEQAVTTMVDQFLSDREYEEFVAMLRYMLDQQPAREQELHVFCADERVWICDAEGTLVRDEEVSTAATAASEGHEVNGEDLAMSILITRSPCKIVIHDITYAAPWPSFSETVERVFLERAQRCRDCTTCSRLLAAGTDRPHLADAPERN
ncbi:sporulation protein YtxC [Alicyclobacillus sp. ALC3]|uniref:sporulation protein YtxC n=1 Tax=Alicyclobacillus sp. ALC3 TaxID=2796143 RepID=UPI0023789411|nr:sporulation protein YtxC [Alicyclobacillus sp. ALC3]WDL96082.1 hypothetical protein JC200_17315 [Alicyclobacillus sp. ALC3]